MTQTIDVTGLALEDVRMLESFVRTMREKPESIGPLPTANDSRATWVEWWRNFCSNQPRLDVVADDSRESIYLTPAAVAPLIP